MKTKTIFIVILIFVLIGSTASQEEYCYPDWNYETAESDLIYHKLELTGSNFKITILGPHVEYFVGDFTYENSGNESYLVLHLSDYEYDSPALLTTCNLDIIAKYSLVKDKNGITGKLEFHSWEDPYEGIPSDCGYDPTQARKRLPYFVSKNWVEPRSLANTQKQNETRPSSNGQISFQKNPTHFNDVINSINKSLPSYPEYLTKDKDEFESTSDYKQRKEQETLDFFHKINNLASSHNNTKVNLMPVKLMNYDANHEIYYIDLSLKMPDIGENRVSYHVSLEQSMASKKYAGGYNHQVGRGNMYLATPMSKTAARELKNSGKNIYVNVTYDLTTKYYKYYELEYTHIVFFHFTSIELIDESGRIIQTY